MGVPIPQYEVHKVHKYVGISPPSDAQLDAAPPSNEIKYVQRYLTRLSNAGKCSARSVGCLPVAATCADRHNELAPIRISYLRNWFIFIDMMLHRQCSLASPFSS